MQYGICNLSIVPLRSEARDSSLLISQVLFGEHFKVLERRRHWSRIRLVFDKCEGWINNKQFTLIEEDIFKGLEKVPLKVSADLVEFVTGTKEELLPISMGSAVSGCDTLGMHYDGRVLSGKHPKENLVKTAFLYLNAPCMSGGRTPFGIDPAGFTQMVYRLNGYALKRSPATQATQGEALSFIEESEPGDLAFFDDEEGQIIHVGIIMENNYIIHAFGQVRIDRIDHSGIFNSDTNTHTHKLRVIKKIF